MTVKEVLALLAYGTEWKLVGGRTGKILCTSGNKKKTRDKYMDMPVTNEPINADFRVYKSGTFYQSIYPIVSIWVSGK